MDPGILEADTAAIVLAVVVAAFVLLALLALRARSRRAELDDDRPEAVEGPKAKPRAPASKEVFAPLPQREALEAGEDEELPEELRDEDEDAAARARGAADAARRSEEKAREEAKTARRSEERAREEAKAADRAEQRAREEAARAASAAEAAEARVVEARASVAPAGDEAADAEAARVEAEARAAAEQARAEAAAKAEAAARAEADKQEKAEAGRRAKDEAARAEAAAKAEAAARAEAEKRAKAEAAAKAEAERKAKAEATAKAEAEKKAKAEAAAKIETERRAQDEAARAEAEEEAAGHTLRDGLGRTRKEGFIARLGGLFAGKAINKELIDEIEEVLFTADIGVRTADRLLDSVRDSLSKKELKDEGKVWSVLHDAASRILGDATANQTATAPKPGEPYVTMVLGVNGSGKTTSIGKLAHQLVRQGQKVTLVAGDTFRAAAAEQLEHWGRRVGADTYRGKEGADPASVVFDGMRGALEKGADHVLVDTAGRLHTQVNLMEELKKVRRVMGNAIPGAPHRVLMVLDATTGQNAINQAKLFKDATAVTGIILTKLDGTAKGGVVLGVCDELGIPIDYIGIGERVADLRSFDSNEFVDELFRPPV